MSRERIIKGSNQDQEEEEGREEQSIWSLRPRTLDEYVGHGVEMGYTVFAKYRRQGFASEAITALAGWAGAEHGVENFGISVGADNGPSMALAEKLGFRKVGEHHDEVDGLEIVLSSTGKSLNPRVS